MKISRRGSTAWLSAAIILGGVCILVRAPVHWLIRSHLNAGRYSAGVGGMKVPSAGAAQGEERVLSNELDLGRGGSPRTNLESLFHVVETDLEQGAEDLDRPSLALSSSELEAMLDALATRGSQTDAELRRQLVRRWAELDPRAAAEWVIRLQSQGANSELLTQVSIVWAEKDFPSAWTWINAMPEGSVKQQALVSAAYEQARIGPREALEASCSLPVSHASENLMLFAISQWASSEGLAAVAWAKQVNEPNLRQKLLASAMISLAQQDGAAAAGFAASLLAPGEEQDRVVVATVQRWAQTSPASAAQWITQFPDTALRQQSVQLLVALWRSQDNAAVSSWMQTLPEGSLRTSVAQAYAQSGIPGGITALSGIDSPP